MVQVNAFRNGLVGPPAVISIKTHGNPLPKINTLETTLLKEVGTSVKIRWERPKYLKKVNWLYGVYYSSIPEKLFESKLINELWLNDGNFISNLFLLEPRILTTNESVLVTNLHACEIYTFAVGVVGPLGYGPLSSNLKQLSTSENIRAPPKSVAVTPLNGDGTKMKMQWAHNCPISIPDHYIVSKNTFITNYLLLISIVNFKNVWLFI